MRGGTGLFTQPRPCAGKGKRMRSLTLRVESPQITINGRPFTLRMSDTELYTRACELFDACERFGGERGEPARALALLNDAVKLIEATLGEGAVAEISEGKPVSLTLALEWLGELAREAAEHCVSDALLEE